jgi:hypothetical protein
MDLIRRRTQESPGRVAPSNTASALPLVAEATARRLAG